MNDFLFARSLMAMSLAFHIIFAALGVGMPMLMAISEAMYLRTGQEEFLELCKRWARGSAVLFGVGAVSGTVLSFELGLLWPAFMDKAGAIIGMPFSLEGFAFFTEAIFFGIYLYTWDRLTPVLHWLSGVLVAISGVLSSVFVVSANAWMNAPAGFNTVDGKITNIDPVAAMLNPAAAHEILHMTLGALVATAFAMASAHARFLIKDRENRFHRCALGIALALGGVTMPMQMLSGDFSAREVGRLQPAKLAAMEADYHTETGPPLLIGGIPDNRTRTTKYAIPVPHGLSFLLTHKFNSKVTGLDAFPPGDWPSVRIVHAAFDLMVAAGTALFLMSLWAGWIWLRDRRLPDRRWFLRGVVLCAPLGFIAIEAGWAVTEVGRQPWIIYGVMRTSEAVTPMPHLAVPFAGFALLYFFLAVVVAVLVRRQIYQPPGHSFNAPEDDKL